MNTLVTLLALAAANPPAAWSISPAPVADRGPVKAGPPLVHTFDLTHPGPAGTLFITRVEANCGCLRQTLTANRLMPGETAKLSIEVNTLTQPDGPNRWQVQVFYTVDTPSATGVLSQPGVQTLAITATLSREVTVTPAQVGFSFSGEAAQVLTVTDGRPKPLTVVKAASTAPHLAAEVAAPAAGANGVRTQAITVKLAADAPAGHRDETVVLYTDDPAYPEFRVPVRVLKRLPGGVVATPDALNVRLTPGEDAVSVLVQLRSPDGKPVAISGVDNDHPAVTTKWAPGAVPVAAVRITVGGPAAAQPGSGTVRVRLAEPAGQEVAIPVSWGRK
ncbi:MAG: DUF1573 domain-containing protein [Gemmataceae bacterium]|nr:DUF1573 domain-containing protein [Gemmataceae bacterium]